MKMANYGERSCPNTVTTNTAVMAATGITITAGMVMMLPRTMLTATIRTAMTIMATAIMVMVEQEIIIRSRPVPARCRMFRGGV